MRTTFIVFGRDWWITRRHLPAPDEITRAPTEAEATLMQRIVDGRATAADRAELRRLLAGESV
jgi:hypothetical protein